MSKTINNIRMYVIEDIKAYGKRICNVFDRKQTKYSSNLSTIDVVIQNYRNIIVSYIRQLTTMLDYNAKHIAI